MLSRRSVALALSSVACATATVVPSTERGIAAFAAPPALSLRSLVSATDSSFVNALTRPDVAVQEANGVQGVSMMACRRNLKKEKRARNEACARKFGKPPATRFRGRGGAAGGAQRSAEDASDNEWLAQIYGQHTIYRRDAGAAMAMASEEDAMKKEAVAA
jgi:hypothetical protein